MGNIGIINNTSRITYKALVTQSRQDYMNRWLYLQESIVYLDFGYSYYVENWPHSK